MLPPKPANTVFAIIVKNERKNLTFDNVIEAENVAYHFASQGQDVVIIDAVTGEMIKGIKAQA